MCSLAADVLAQCFVFLDHRDLCRVSLVSQEWRSLAAPRKLSKLTIRISSLGNIASEINTCRELLGTRLKYVQSLWIQRERRARPDEVSRWRFMSSRGSDPFQPWPSGNLRGDQHAHALANVTTAWQDLIAFITSLKALRDVVWDLEGQIPLTIVRCLNTRQSPCRLYIHHFRLDSLQTMVKLSPEDRELAESPCLYSIESSFFDNHWTEFATNVLFEMTAGAAPNLREVSWTSMGERYKPSYPGSWNRPSPPLPSWQPGTLHRASAKGTLKNLSLYGDRTIQQLETWQSYTDFAKLEKLKLVDDFEPQFFEWIVANCRFPRLEDLTISPPITPQPHTWREWRYTNASRDESSIGPNPQSMPTATLSAFETFMTSLRRMTELRLVPWAPQTSPSRFLSSLSCSLRLFHCDKMFVDLNFVEILRKRHPQIEELELSLERQNGSTAEVKLYRALGSLIQLQRLQLLLQAPKSMRDLQETVQDECPNALRNFALDQSLASSIFRAISNGKPQGYSVPRLLFLRLRVNSSQGPATDVRLDNLLRTIARSWICEINPDDDAHPKGCNVKADAGESPPFDPNSTWLDDITKSQYGPALLSVWPECRNRRLPDVWHSFPLLSIDTELPHGSTTDSVSDVLRETLPARDDLHSSTE